MRADARRAVERHFEAYLRDASPELAFSPALLRRSIGGIIDFSSAGLGDPASNIAGLLSPVSYGEAFVQLLAPSYPGLADLLGRAHFYVGTFALQEALWGFEHADQTALRSGLVQYI